MGFKRFVSILEIVVGIAAVVFVVALFVNEPSDESGATSRPVRRSTPRTARRVTARTVRAVSGPRWPGRSRRSSPTQPIRSPS